jgi:uncharacterized protein (DUF1330 family)
MGAEVGRFVLLLGLEVRDEEGYARYRERMQPILAAFGGAFGCDVRVSEVLIGAPPSVNRLFTLSFPDRRRREAFFADVGYQRVRAEHFAPAVGEVAVLGEMQELPRSAGS